MSDPWEYRRRISEAALGPIKGAEFHERTRDFIESVGPDTQPIVPNFYWMHEAIYEPAPLPRRRAMSSRIFLILAAIAIVCGGLWAIEPIYEVMK